jgi:hypothetical protein
MPGVINTFSFTDDFFFMDDEKPFFIEALAVPQARSNKA